MNEWSDRVTSSVTFQFTFKVRVMSMIVDVCQPINVGFRPVFSTVKLESRMNSSIHSPLELVSSPHNMPCALLSIPIINL